MMEMFGGAALYTLIEDEPKTLCENIKLASVIGATAFGLFIM